MGLFSGLVVQQEQQGEDMNGSNGRQDTGGVLEFRSPQRATDCEGAVEQPFRWQVTVVRIQQVM